PAARQDVAQGRAGPPGAQALGAGAPDRGRPRREATCRDRPLCRPWRHRRRLRRPPPARDPAVLRGRGRRIGHAVRLLLDTHVWLWLALDPGRLTADLREHIARADTEVFVSVVSRAGARRRAHPGNGGSTGASVPRRDARRRSDLTTPASAP